MEVVYSDRRGTSNAGVQGSSSSSSSSSKATMVINQLRRASPPTKAKSDSLSTATGMATPKSNNGLPPKSPSSMTGRLLQSATRSVVPKRRSKSKRRGSRRSRRGGDSGSTSTSNKSAGDEEQSSGELSSSHSREAGGDSSESLEKGVAPALELTLNRSLSDPMSTMKVAGNADDFFSTPDLNTVSFEATPSPTSVLADSSLGNSNSANKDPCYPSDNIWDPNDLAYGELPSAKSCVPSLFRRQKVMSADVASVGNASDTLVAVGEAGGRITGRELHEKAKAVLNAGNYNQAVLMFEALQKAQIERFGECHSSVAAATHNVAVVRLRMGQAERAEELFEEAVEMRRKVLGNDHLDLAASLAKLGSSRVALQKFDDGLEVLREALNISRKILGGSNKTVAQILCHIACLYFEAGELFSAQSTFEDALEIYREVFPREADRNACMAQMTETLCNIGSIQNKRKNFTAAIDCFREALDLQRGIMGHDHPRVVATLDNLGYSFSKSKSYNQALTCYKEMLTAQISRYGSFTSECCETLKKEIIIHEKMKDVDGAIKAANKALKRVCQDSPVPTSSVSFEIEQIIADLKQKQGNRRRGEF